MRSDYLLLDTNIVSYIMTGASTAGLYKEHLSGKRLAISFILSVSCGPAQNLHVGAKKDETSFVKLSVDLW